MKKAAILNIVCILFLSLILCNDSAASTESVCGVEHACRSSSWIEGIVQLPMSFLKYLEGDCDNDLHHDNHGKKIPEFVEFVLKTGLRLVNYTLSRLGLSSAVIVNQGVGYTAEQDSAEISAHNVGRISLMSVIFLIFCMIVGILMSSFLHRFMRKGGQKDTNSGIKRQAGRSKRSARKKVDSKYTNTVRIKRTDLNKVETTKPIPLCLTVQHTPTQHDKHDTVTVAPCPNSSFKEGSTQSKMTLSLTRVAADFMSARNWPMNSGVKAESSTSSLTRTAADFMAARNWPMTKRSALTEEGYHDLEDSMSLTSKMGDKDRWVTAKYDYKAEKKPEPDMEKNEKPILADDKVEWQMVQNSRSKSGYVPSNYVKRAKPSSRSTLGRKHTNESKSCGSPVASRNESSSGLDALSISPADTGSDNNNTSGDNNSTSRDNNSTSSDNNSTSSDNNSKNSDNVQVGDPVQPVVVKYNYTAQQQNELSLTKGEIVIVLEKSSDGWWNGRKGSSSGWFPSNYVELQINTRAASLDISTQEIVTPLYGFTDSTAEEVSFEKVDILVNVDRPLEDPMWRQSRLPRGVVVALLPIKYVEIAEDIIVRDIESTIIDNGDNTIVPDVTVEEKIQTGRWWHDLVAGGVAGAVSRTCTAPLDRLKTLLQVHGSNVEKKDQLTIPGGFKHMVKEGGVKSMWRGNGINVVKIAPKSAIKFMVYGQAKTYLKCEDKEIGMMGRFAAGATAGVISQACIYPMEVMKTRLAISKTGHYKGVADLAYKLFKNEGPRVFFKGFVPEMIGVIPFTGIDLCLYETLKELYKKKHKDKEHGALLDVVCGVTASMTAVAATYPFALVRTRMQAEATSDISMSSMFKKIYRTDGFKGYYRGVGLNIMKVVPATAIVYGIFASVKKLLGNKKS